ncbi:hypothetical protein EYC80_003946 [Monilinia laxa]|uniref:Uncharacterized protein n=1 Tax=Monilinia laxa TaxID=61186 RepID=A0A5N6KL94_MONLA|nr:hypothetical protein EYC80_003946 [Monilinia laxa]
MECTRRRWLCCDTSGMFIHRSWSSRRYLLQGCISTQSILKRLRSTPGPREITASRRRRQLTPFPSLFDRNNSLVTDFS